MREGIYYQLLIKNSYRSIIFAQVLNTLITLLTAMDQCQQQLMQCFNSLRPISDNSGRASGQNCSENPEKETTLWWADPSPQRRKCKC